MTLDDLLVKYETKGVSFDLEYKTGFGAKLKWRSMIKRNVYTGYEEGPSFIFDYEKIDKDISFIKNNSATI